MVALIVFAVLIGFALYLLHLREPNFTVPAAMILLLMAYYGYSEGITYTQQTGVKNSTCIADYVYNATDVTNVTMTCTESFVPERISPDLSKFLFVTLFFFSLIVTWEYVIHILGWGG